MHDGILTMAELKGKQRLNEALNGPQRPSPVLSAFQFMHATNEIPADPDGVQGASLDPRTGRLLQAGVTDRWMVGGHPDNSGEAIEEKSVPGRGINFRQALDHVQRVSRLTQGQPAAVAAGSWYSPKKKHIALDASTPIERQDVAEQLMKDRDEDAIFHLKSFNEVKNPLKASS